MPSKRPRTKPRGVAATHNTDGGSDVANTAQEPMRARAALVLPPELIDAVADRVLHVLDERLPLQQQWMGVDEAAAHLCCSKHRIYHLVSERRIPHEREGARLLFDRQALDAWVRKGGAR